MPGSDVAIKLMAKTSQILECKGEQQGRDVQSPTMCCVLYFDLLNDTRGKGTDTKCQVLCLVLCSL